MSNDVAIQPIAAAHSASDVIGGPSQASVAPSPEQQPAAKSPPIYNPTVRFDSTLGLVVIEFRNDSGVVTTQVPSQQQLDAYQRWNETRLGPMPAGLNEPAPKVSVTPVVTPPPRAETTKETRARK